MKASSQDLRECVLRAVDQRYPRIEIVQFLGISLSTLKRYLRTTTLQRLAKILSHETVTAQMRASEIDTMVQATKKPQLSVSRFPSAA